MRRLIDTLRNLRTPRTRPAHPTCPARPFRHTLRSLLFLFSLLVLPPALLADGTDIPSVAGDEANRSALLGVKLDEDRLSIFVDGALFTCYRFAPDQKYPYFWPVNGPLTGRSVTTETSEPYPHHHSLFFACDRVNGGNFWQEGLERGQIVSEGPRIIEATGDRVHFTDRCFWIRPGSTPVIEDHRSITVSARASGTRVIDFEIAIKPLKEVTIERTNHALFSARVVPALSVKEGGTLINAARQSGEKGTFGVPSPWCDYHGTRDGATEGIAILQNPRNRWYPAPWFTRDYGFFSPTPMYWLEGGKVVLPQGQVFTLRYRVLVHGGDSREAGVSAHFARYARDAKALPADAEPAAPVDSEDPAAPTDPFSEFDGETDEKTDEKSDETSGVETDSMQR